MAKSPEEKAAEKIAEKARIKAQKDTARLLVADYKSRSPTADTHWDIMKAVAVDNGRTLRSVMAAFAQVNFQPEQTMSYSQWCESNELTVRHHDLKGLRSKVGSPGGPSALKSWNDGVEGAVWGITKIGCVLFVFLIAIMFFIGVLKSLG